MRVSRPPQTRPAPATSLAWIVGACALLALYAGSARALGRQPVTRAGPTWFERPPPGCALGIAGPTLGAATALRTARDAAFAALAAERLGVNVSSEISWVGRRVRERSSEETSGTLHGVWIAGLRRRPGGGIDAVACGEDVRLRSRRGHPGHRWPPGFHRVPHCAIGIAGDGLGPGDQARNALRDAREMLARAVEARVAHRLELDGGHRVDRSHSVRASAMAAQLIDEAAPSLKRSQWVDRSGRGPLRRPGLLYIELCLPES